MQFIVTMENSSPSDINVLLDNHTMKIDATQYLSNFIAEVETFLTYKIASYINQYWFPILVPIGLLGNTLSFLVMIKPNNKESINLYLHGSNKSK